VSGEGYEFVKCDEADTRQMPAFCSVRRQRSFHKTFAFLAVTLGVMAAPAAARAAASDDTDTVPAVSADPPAEPAAPQSEPPAPQPDPEPQPAPAPEPEPTSPPTTAPQEDPAPEPTAPPTTQPDPTPAAGSEPEPAHRPPVDVPAPVTPAPSSQPSTSTAPDASDEDGAPADVAGIDGITRDISFPVLGPVRYSNDFGACRDGCARHHQGNDMIGVRMQPLLAAVDGTITEIRYESHGDTAAAIKITGADGWYYGYYHVNNDTPGTDDGQATHQWQVPPGLTVGSPVRAGQVIGYMGDSGNAEFSVPHLHFEIRMADHTPVNPYHSLVAAQRRESCTPDVAWTNTPLEALSPSAVAVIPLSGGGRWVIDADGRLHAEGPAAEIQPAAGVDCATVEPLPVESPVAAAADPAPAPIADPSPEPAVPAAQVADPRPEPTAPAPTSGRWTVEPGDSLWHIVQRAYGTSGTAATASAVMFVFDHNRDQLTDPNLLTVGMELELPPLEG
jgi:murein DD-endopeptidase MepM/ murein hydrolase activator NlpD